MILALNALASDILWEVFRAIGMICVIVLACVIGATLRKHTDKKKAEKEAQMITDAVSEDKTIE